MTADATSLKEIPEIFTDTTYSLRRNVLTFLGGALTLANSEGRVVCFTRQKAFKFKEDIRLYTDESEQDTLLTISARNVIDFSAGYDVSDPATGRRIGALRRKGFKSMFRDEWTIMDTNDHDLVVIREDSLGMALVRRNLTNLVPQKFTGMMDGRPVLTFRQAFNPVVLKMRLDFSMDRELLLDRRLGIAAAVLIALIEGRQN
jgi:hypothetical protein